MNTSSDKQNTKSNAYTKSHTYNTKLIHTKITHIQYTNNTYKNHTSVIQKVINKITHITQK